MVSIICPYCKKPIESLVKKGGSGSHYRKCKKDNNIFNDIPTFVDVALYNFKQHAAKEFIENKIINEHYSVYEFDNKFFNGISFCRKLANFYNIPLLSIHESASNPRARQNYVNTCLKRYGAINSCAAGTKARQKAEQTMKDKYGVINFWCIPNFQDYLKNKIGEKEYHKRKSIRSHNVWANKTADEKNDWIAKSLFSTIKPSNKIAGTNSSKAEIKFISRLIELGFEVETQYKILSSIDKLGKKHYYFYDVRLKDSNILIEFNGDYYHANPLVYNENDIIKVHTKSLLVRDIWEKDKKKKYVAEKNNFKVIYIWESEFNSSSFEETLFNKLCEVGYGDFKIEEHQKN